jgi:hypothetical protein
VASEIEPLFRSIQHDENLSFLEKAKVIRNGVDALGVGIAEHKIGLALACRPYSLDHQGLRGDPRMDLGGRQSQARRRRLHSPPAWLLVSLVRNQAMEFYSRIKLWSGFQVPNTNI